MGLEVDGSREAMIETSRDILETLSMTRFAVQNSIYRILPLPSRNPTILVLLPLSTLHTLSSSHSAFGKLLYNTVDAEINPHKQ
mmetsp:Transcript_17758/g.27202  ORF Transcript_17758/g.27202 Transcript_17758/m.27202 type:complete len:84 (+) Transcript_17758:402-653(+)